MGSIFLEGMLLQASLIFALGPQNLFVLESGLRRNHHIAISFVCFLCDFSLIMLGVAGAATFFNKFPEIKILVGMLGVIFLILYGIEKLKEVTFTDYSTENKVLKSGIKAAVISAITFSIVNPHAYLDGIVLIGGYSSKYPELVSRLCLGMGAATFSLVWFLMLSHGAGIMIPVFANKRSMKFIMYSAGICLIFLSAKLSMDVYGWVEELYPETTASLSFTWR